jgi:hypothetical protein
MHFYDHIEEKHLTTTKHFLDFIAKKQLVVVKCFLICIT